MFSSKQTHMFSNFVCYHIESGWHVTRPNQGLSLGRAKNLGTRLRNIIKNKKIRNIGINLAPL